MFLRDERLRTRIGTNYTNYHLPRASMLQVGDNEIEKQKKW